MVRNMERSGRDLLQGTIDITKQASYQDNKIKIRWSGLVARMESTYITVAGKADGSRRLGNLTFKCEVNILKILIKRARV